MDTAGQRKLCDRGPRALDRQYVNVSVGGQLAERYGVEHASYSNVVLKFLGLSNANGNPNHLDCSRPRRNGRAVAIPILAALFSNGDLDQRAAVRTERDVHLGADVD
jgi:hypothetical protein